MFAEYKKRLRRAMQLADNKLKSLYNKLFFMPTLMPNIQASLGEIATTLQLSSSSLRLIRDRQRERHFRAELRRDGNPISVRFYALMLGDEEVGTATSEQYHRGRNRSPGIMTYNLHDGKQFDYEVISYL